MLTYYLPANLPLVVSVGPCVYWLIFFAIGVYYSDNSRDYPLWFPICLLFIGGIMQILEHKILVDLGKGGIGIKLTSWIYSTGAVLILISEKFENKYYENKVVSVIKTIGVNSFGIYLVHMLLLLPICRLTNCWITNWILAVICSMTLILILKEIFPKLSNKYLGFKQ